jgi:hypothetical protein
MWRGITLFTFDVKRNYSSHLCKEESLFTFDVKKSHSSNLMWRGVTLHFWCRVTLHIWSGEESLFTLDRCGEESLFTFDMESSSSSRLMWRKVTLKICWGDRFPHFMWRGVTFHISCKEESLITFGEESLFTFDVVSCHSSHSESLAVESSHFFTFDV